MLGGVVTHAFHGTIALGRRGYRAWMPFDGGPRFVLLHAIAWTLVGVLADVLIAVGPRALVTIRGGPSAVRGRTRASAPFSREALP